VGQRVAVLLLPVKKQFPSQRKKSKGLIPLSASPEAQDPPACLFCDQAQETAPHLLLSCVFTRQIWTLVFSHLNLVVDVPVNSSSFSAWWGKVIRAAPNQWRKGLNSLIILVAWEIWKHRNSCVFEGVLPNSQVLLQAITNESTLWCLAGASKLKELLARSLVAPS